jgi:hypothetical protein
VAFKTISFARFMADFGFFTLIQSLEGPRLDAGQKRVIAELYGKGKTIPELAAEYEVGVGTSGGRFNPKPAA